MNLRPAQPALANALGAAYRIARVALAALLLTVAVAGVAHAEDAKAMAKARFLSGTKHYNLSEFKEALLDFREAYRYLEDSVFLFNVAQCQRQLGDYDAAIFSYRAYLRVQPDAPNRVQVEERIHEMTEAQRRRIQLGPPSGVLREESAAPPAATGVEATTGEPRAAPPAATGSSTPRTDGSAAPTLVRSASQRRGEATPIYKRWWLWTTLAAVAVLAGAGIGLGIALSSGENLPATPLGNLDLR